ncbi:hypothetical protein BJ546DRAFT_1029608 [Cryomyces antarcticus]
MSDLHLEAQSYADFTVPARAPSLLLCGDVGQLVDYEHYLRFLQSQCRQFSHVYLTLGNHEFFHATRKESLAKAASLEQEPSLSGKLTVLNRKRVDIPGSDVALLGCTLHSFVPRESRAIVNAKMLDFRVIGDWSLREHNKEHLQDVEWLRGQVASIASNEPRRRIMIATHHAPSHINTYNAAHRSSPWGSAFATGLLETEVKSWPGSKHIAAWVFGHTHWNTDDMHENVRLVSNQRGVVPARWIPPSFAQARKRYRSKARSWIARLRGQTSAFDVAKVISV